MDCLTINYKSFMKMCLTPCSRGGMTNQNITAKDKKASFLKNILVQTWTKYQIWALPQNFLLAVLKIFIPKLALQSIWKWIRKGTVVDFLYKLKSR